MPLGNHSRGGSRPWRRRRRVRLYAKTLQARAHSLAILAYFVRFPRLNRIPVVISGFPTINNPAGVAWNASGPGSARRTTRELVRYDRARSCAFGRKTAGNAVDWVIPSCRDVPVRRSARPPPSESWCMRADRRWSRTRCILAVSTCGALHRCYASTAGASVVFRVF